MFGNGFEIREYIKHQLTALNQIPFPKPHVPSSKSESQSETQQKCSYFSETMSATLKCNDNKRLNHSYDTHIPLRHTGT